MKNSKIVGQVANKPMKHKYMDQCCGKQVYCIPTVETFLVSCSAGNFPRLNKNDNLQQLYLKNPLQDYKILKMDLRFDVDKKHLKQV